MGFFRKEEYFCPNCNAVLNCQYGFDPDDGSWTCTECGKMLMDDDVYDGDRFEGVAWYCDSCGALMNRQSGFSDCYDIWNCKKCGFQNRIAESEIGDKPQYNCPHCHSGLDHQIGFSEYDKEYQCSECGARLRHIFSSEPYEVVDEDDDYNDENYEDFDEEHYEAFDEDDEDDRSCDDPWPDVDKDRNAEIFRTARRLKEQRQQSNSDGISLKKVKNGVITLFWIIVVLLIIVVIFEYRLLTPIGHSSDQFIGLSYEEVINRLEESGFENIVTNEVDDLPLAKQSQENLVTDVIIWKGVDSFDADDKFPSNYRIQIVYHTLESFGVPMSSKEAKGKNVEDVANAFSSVGFKYIEYNVEYDIITGWLTDDEEVKSVVVNDDKHFSRGAKYKADSVVTITYHTLRKNKPK